MKEKEDKKSDRFSEKLSYFSNKAQQEEVHSQIEEPKSNQLASAENNPEASLKSEKIVKIPLRISKEEINSEIEDINMEPAGEKPKLENADESQNIDHDSEPDQELEQELTEQENEDDINSENQEVDILKFIPELDLENSTLIDNFKKTMIQIILEFQIESPEAFEALIEATLLKNPDVEEEAVREMFSDIEEFIKHFNNGDFDNSSFADDSFND